MEYYSRGVISNIATSPLMALIAGSTGRHTQPLLSAVAIPKSQLQSEESLRQLALEWNPSAQERSTAYSSVIPVRYRVDKRVWDTSLLLVERLRYALIGMINCIDSAVTGLGYLLEGIDNDKKLDNGLKAVGASLGIAGAGLGIGALVAGIFFAPVTGGVSLAAAGLGFGVGGTGTLIHATSKALYRKKLTLFNEMADGFITAFNEHHKALAKILKKIDSNVEMLVIKFKLERITALVVTLANPEEIDITTEFIRRIRRNVVIDGLWKVGEMIYSNIRDPTGDESGKIPSELPLACGIAKLHSHSGHLATLLKAGASGVGVGIRVGMTVAGGAAVGVGGILSIVDMVNVISEWKNVPPSVQSVKGVKEELAKNKVVYEESLTDVERLEIELRSNPPRDE